MDVSHSKPNHTRYDYTQEKNMLLNSDIILYLFDFSKLLTEKEEYFKRMSREIRAYCQMLASHQETINKEKIIPDVVAGFLNGFTKGLAFAEREGEPNQKIFIALGTFSDKLKDLQEIIEILKKGGIL